MPDCFLTALKIHIDDVLKYNTLYIFCKAALRNIIPCSTQSNNSTLICHLQLKVINFVPHKAINILEGTHAQKTA